ncbi:MAG: AraC family transcriptional regulator ligand-binding domain-containing protein [Serpentinimonas sp.]|nr:AraC family transcriptional regulator ligand-binding domain-containing protein [Serpentinimonas sp.]
MSQPVQPIQHTIAIQQVAYLLLGLECVEEKVRILKRANIAPALLESKLARVTQSQYARLMTLLARHLRDEMCGLCSRPLPLGSFASGCRLLVGNGTLGDAMRTGLRYYHALLHDFVPRLQLQHGVAYLQIRPRRPMTPGQYYAVRVFMFFGYGVMCWLAARRIPITEVVYHDRDVARRSEASRLFQAPIMLADNELGFRFDARWLDLPVVQNARTVEEFLRRAPASLLLKYRDQTSYTERIRRILRRHLAGDMPSLERVSELLATTPQTLRRRLQAEGHGYQAIKDAVRRDVAVEYLTGSDLSQPDIAARLGFAETSTFHRAFKAWTGLTPGAYRQAHRADSAATPWVSEG